MYFTCTIMHGLASCSLNFALCVFFFDAHQRIARSHQILQFLIRALGSTLICGAVPGLLSAVTTCG